LSPARLTRRLREAWRQVKTNAGAAGVDQMTVEEFEERKEQLLPLIYKNLKAGTYRFKPAAGKRSWAECRPTS